MSSSSSKKVSSKRSGAKGNRIPFLTVRNVDVFQKCGTITEDGVTRRMTDVEIEAHLANLKRDLERNDNQSRTINFDVYQGRGTITENGITRNMTDAENKAHLSRLKNNGAGFGGYHGGASGRAPSGSKKDKLMKK